MEFKSNGTNEIHFVDGAEHSLLDWHKEALTSAAAHFLDCFRIEHEVDVYVSRRSVLHAMSSNSRAWHIPPTFDRDNSLVCVYIDPDAEIEDNIELLAHEMIHAWQVDRGDLVGHAWKGVDCTGLPYNLQPWEIEAHGHMGKVAKYFFSGDRPTRADLTAITSTTDQIFASIEETVKASALREKATKVAKVAAALGLGLLVGI